MDEIRARALIARLPGLTAEQLRPLIAAAGGESAAILTRRALDAPDLPPASLYVLGSVPALASPQLAMVGSRSPTEAGRATARDFAAYFARCGLTVTSGLALGIDAASHEGALAAGGLTVAVFGTGLDRVYPA